ncbi:hypothetical protein L7F22_022073 [Adiantum nelumboides]|nr:hypothetical protein [Adiantum nelumboides]
MLTQKEVPFSWGITEVTAFQTLKYKMTTGPVLILRDLQKSFEVYCDACGRSLGAVLMQEGRSIAYESRMFSKPEMTAQIYEKELLAVIHALTQWRHYLLGVDFTVFTDHRSLHYYLSQKQLSEKQMRWANILSQFHFQIVDVQGQKNVVADALSRKPLVQTISAIHHSTFEDMVDQYATDTDFVDIFTRIRDGRRVAGYSIREGYLMRKAMLCVTQPLWEKVMTECHCPPFTGHRGIATTMKRVERYFYWPRLKKDVEEFVRSCLVCQMSSLTGIRHRDCYNLYPYPPVLGKVLQWISFFISRELRDGIWTIIDRFSKQTHFIPVKKTVKPDHLARLFVAQIFRLHGMPKTIVSDRDPRFTSLFWKAFARTLARGCSSHPRSTRRLTGNLRLPIQWFWIY